MKKLSSILLVDDDSTTNFLNKLLLNSLAVADELLVAENGVEALAALTRACNGPDALACPALVLLDVNMPVMNGLAFLEAYQQLPLLQQRPIVIIMLTTSVNERELARMAELPVAGFVSKPLTREKVAAILRQHFQLQLPGSQG